MYGVCSLDGLDSLVVSNQLFGNRGMSYVVYVFLTEFMKSSYKSLQVGHELDIKKFDCKHMDGVLKEFSCEARLFNRTTKVINVVVETIITAPPNGLVSFK